MFVSKPCLVLLSTAFLCTDAILFGSQGGCGSFGCASGGCSQCDPPPPCASPPPPPPLPCDSCGRRKREMLISKGLNQTCSHDKLKEIIEKAFDKESTAILVNLNATLHHSDHMLIMCTPRKHDSIEIMARMDHFCAHEDDKNVCYVFGTGLRAKEVK
ncbi:hypothetical protein QR680_018222 [Steinernema hermaphroditum]|uniref:Ground-like domain-containing protein n=1 Tax=Steinernema hermaphroditum TaxID=289476 RepID=A0AA39HH92_9BILA|nr:hypothetical protein QR680_018222 [Steinernema hermaphroditum]